MEFIGKLLELLKTPEFYACVIAFTSVLTALGWFFKKLGELIPGDDWTDGASAWISKAVTFIGKVLSFVGIGNAKK